MIRLYKLPSNTHLGSSLREMEEKDVTNVAALYTRYMQRFSMAPSMTVEEIRHQFLSGKGTGEKRKEDARREGQVVWTYVVEVNNYTLWWQQFPESRFTGPKNAPYNRLLLFLFTTIHNYQQGEPRYSRSSILVLLRHRRCLRRTGRRRGSFEETTAGPNWRRTGHRGPEQV